MKATKRLVLGLPLFSVLLLGSPASAQEPDLHHVRAGLQLASAAEETKLIHAALSAKVFDVGLTRSLVEEVARSIQSAKQSSDRAQALLPEAKQSLEAEFEKLRGVIKRAEDQAAKLRAVLTQETQGLEAEDQEGGALDARADGDEPAAQPRWNVLKDETGWLFLDLSEARALHQKLGPKLKAPGLSAPPKPKSKRE